MGADERRCELRGRALDGTTIDRVVHQDDEVRVYLSAASDRMYLWFRGVSGLDGLEADGAVVSLLTEEIGPDQERVTYRLRSEEAAILRVEAGAWSWHPIGEDERFAFDLAGLEREVVREAIEVVVRRDLDAVRRLLAVEEIDCAPEFWSAADEYGRGHLELALPAGDFDAWNVRISDGGDGRRAIEAEMWAHGEGRTDLSLTFSVTPRPDGSFAVELEDLHVL